MPVFHFVSVFGIRLSSYNNIIIIITYIYVRLPRVLDILNLTFHVPTEKTGQKIDSTRWNDKIPNP